MFDPGGPTVLLSALRRELAGRSRRVPGTVRLAGGVGRANAAAAAVDADLHHNPRRVVSVGYCGGLDPRLSVGDVVTAAAVLAPDGARFPADPLGPDPVTVATADAPALSAAAKAALFADTGAAVVDMEAAGVAAACADLGVPFSAVKVVTDAAVDALPPDLAPFLDAAAGVRGSLRRCGRAFAERPGLLGDLRRLARASRGCSKNLAAYLDRYLPPLEPPGPKTPPHRTEG